MPVLEPEHDFAHPVEGDSAWSESYYFNCYDPANDTGFFTRIGIRPNEGTMDVGCSIWVPGTELAVLMGKVEQHEMVEKVLEVGAVRYEMVEPMKRWRITADGHAFTADLSATDSKARQAPVSMEVEFEALTPAIGADAQGTESQGVGRETKAITGKGHLEQAGRWHGWIEVDGKRAELSAEARGNRDKSWGPRRWGGPLYWRWFSVNIGDDIAFGGIRIGTDAGDLSRGWIWKDGEHASIRNWDIHTSLEDDGFTQREVDVVATDKLGRDHKLHGRLLRVAPIPRTQGGESTLINEGLAEWTYEGRTGYGIAEYHHRLGDDGRPVVAVE